MPLSARELLLVLRARDEASRVLRGFGREFGHLSAQAQAAVNKHMAAGTALATVGVGMAAVGAIGLKFMYDATKVAIAYEQQVALTRTQVDQLGVSLQQIGDIGRRIARDIAVPFEQLQPALYDIFSSMDVSIPQAEVLLRSFAKTAVAGQVDIQTAGRATISIMNAFHVPVSKVNHIMDVMFRLVQKGVGTYGEFARTIGRSIPSAVRAGQSIETLAGMLAFLTRNGLSAAMASASAGRALDAFSNPKVVDRLTAMGISVKDAKGQFRDLGPIMTDLQKKFEGMTKPQLAKALHNLFLGAGGTIQARRFFDMVLSSSKSVKEFNQRIGEMGNASGIAAQKYGQMADTTASKTQVLSNNWTLLKEAIGSALKPAFDGLIDSLIKVLQWFNNLDPSTKKLVATIGLVTAAVLILTGALTVLAGVALIAAAAIATVGAPVALVVAGVVLAIGLFIAFGAALVYAYNKSETFRDRVNAAWKQVVDFYNQSVKPKLLDIKDIFVNHLLPALKKVKEDGLDALNKAFRDIKKALDDNKPAIEAMTNALNRLWAILKKVATFILDYVVPVLSKVLAGAIRLAGAQISVLIYAVGLLIDIFRQLYARVQGVINLIKGGFKIDLKATGQAIVRSLISGILSMVSPLGSAVGSLVQIIRDHMPHSPAKKGPLSGRGYPLYAGQAVAKALALGMTSSQSRVLAAAQSIATAAHRGLNEHRPGFRNWLVRGLDRENAQLSKIASQRATIATQIKTATEMATKIHEYADNVTSNALSYGGVATSDVMARKLQVLNNFAGMISKLRAMGLNKTSIDQIIQQGVEGGSSTATILLGGGKAEIDRINKLQVEIGNAAKNLGETAAESYFGYGTKVADGIIAGLKSKDAQLAAAMLRMAKLMAAQLKKALGIRSPAKLFVPHGEMTAMGIVKGVLNKKRHVQNTIDNLVNPKSFGPVGPGGIGGGGGLSIQSPITVYTAEINPVQNAIELGRELWRRVPAR